MDCCRARASKEGSKDAGALVLEFAIKVLRRKIVFLGGLLGLLERQKNRVWCFGLGDSSRF